MTTLEFLVVYYIIGFLMLVLLDWAGHRLREYPMSVIAVVFLFSMIPFVIYKNIQLGIRHYLRKRQL